VAITSAYWNKRYSRLYHTCDSDAATRINKLDVKLQYSSTTPAVSLAHDCLLDLSTVCKRLIFFHLPSASYHCLATINIQTVLKADKINKFKLAVNIHNGIQHQQSQLPSISYVPGLRQIARVLSSKLEPNNFLESSTGIK
jgi:hypothetical protein